MRIKDVVAQLRARLPIYTELFTDEFNITSLSESGGVITAVTDVPHGLSSNNEVWIRGALTQNQVTSLVEDKSGEPYISYALGYQSAAIGGFPAQQNKAFSKYYKTKGHPNITPVVCIGQTQDDHDLTERYTSTVDIVGSNESQYNGEKFLLRTENRRHFVCFLGEDAAATPATGDIKLLYTQSFGYNGMHTVTVVDPTTLTYPSDISFSLPAAGDIKMRAKVRVSGVIDLARAQASYTSKKDKKYYMFVTSDSTTASKNRDVKTDETDEYNNKGYVGQVRITNISLHVFAPVKKESADGLDTRDQVESLIAPIAGSMLGVKFPGGGSETEPYSGAVYVGDSPAGYGDSFYVHTFNFSSTMLLNYLDAADKDFNIAFRDIDFDFGNSLTAEVNLDDKPIT